MKLSSLVRGAPVYMLPLAVLLVAVVARMAAPDLLERLSLFSFDLYQRLSPRQPVDAPIRVVDIDDRSLAKIGQWPWPRTIIAELVDNLRKAGAAVIAFDIDFAERDRTSPKMLEPLIAKAGPGAAAASQLLATLPDPDAALAEAMKKVPVVTGFILTDHGDKRPPLAKAGFALAGNDPLGHVDSFPGVVPDLPMFEQAAAGNGFLNQYLDWDHVVRRVPLILRLNNHPEPSLAAEALRVALGAHTYIGKAAGANNDASFGQNTGLTAIRIGNVTIPTDAAGRVWVHFAPLRPDRFVSAIDVLEGRFDPAKFADNIVLVGTSAEGVINDQQATPIAPDVPGVEIHAQLIEEILQGAFLVRPDWAVGAETLFTMLIGIGLILGLPRIGALPSAALGMAAIVAGIGASWLAFQHAQLLVDPVYPTIVLVIVYLFASLLGYLRTEVRQREIRGAFSRYMSPHYVEVLAAHPEKLVLGGETRQLTIMFCDIRGFTTISEGLDAHSLTMLMNSFTSPMTDIITEHRGTIDKYIGDCIMAFWNAPLDDPEHAKNAVRAAKAMRRKLAELNRGWEAEARAAGRPFKPLRFGIGINSGECVVGNFGSTQRFNYSILGDPVNLASRLEGLGKVYGVDLVIGEDTAELIDEADLIELDLVAVKGKTQAVRVFTIAPEEEGAEARLPSHHAALLRAYRQQEWSQALDLLVSSELARARFLAPLYQLYRERIAHFMVEAPPEDWDGVFTAQTK